MRLHISLVLAAALAASSAVAADKHGRGAGWQKHAGRDDHGRTEARYFVPDDVRVLREYYRPRALPPGLQKKLYRTGRLPPGWEKKLRPFPVIVERRLVELPPYYRRGFLDGYAVVYDPRTRIIIDLAVVFP